MHCIIGSATVDVSLDIKKAPYLERFFNLDILLEHQLVEFLHKLRGVL